MMTRRRRALSYLYNNNNNNRIINRHKLHRDQQRGQLLQQRQNIDITQASNLTINTIITINIITLTSTEKQV
jgi:hypothetical protein